MLRKSTYSPLHKELPVPQLANSVNEVVELEVKNPLTKEKFIRKESIVKVTHESAQDAVRLEEADLYSVENMQKVGLSPVVAPANFIKQDLSAVGNIENVSSELLDQITEHDVQVGQEENVEPTKTE